MRKSFDGADYFAFDVAGEGKTGTHRFAVDQHRARTADADAATFDGAFEFQLVAQEFQKSLMRVHGDFFALAVDRGGDGNFILAVLLAGV